MKNDSRGEVYKTLYQKIFDLIFNKIEVNMREIGFSDTTINKNMRFLVKTFYNILFNCEKYKDMSNNDKNKFLIEYLQVKNSTDNKDIIDYFNKYEAFCFDLKPDSVLRGEINFNY